MSSAVSKTNSKNKRVVSNFDAIPALVSCAVWCYDAHQLITLFGIAPSCFTHDINVIIILTQTLRVCDL